MSDTPDFNVEPQPLESKEMEEDVDGEVVSDIEFILPWEVIETCSRLKTGGSSCFWSVNKEAQTSSQLSIHKLVDMSIKIRVTVLSLGKLADDATVLDNLESFRSDHNQQVKNDNIIGQTNQIHTKIPDRHQTTVSSGASPNSRNQSVHPETAPGQCDVESCDQVLAMDENGLAEKGNNVVGKAQTGKSVADIASAKGSTVIIVKTVPPPIAQSMDQRDGNDSDAVGSGIAEGGGRGEDEYEYEANVAVKKASRDIAERLKNKKKMMSTVRQSVTSVVEPAAAAPLHGKTDRNGSSMRGGRGGGRGGGGARAMVTSSASSGSTVNSRSSYKDKISEISSDASNVLDEIQCELCGERVDSYVSLVRHVRQSHTDCTFVRTYLEEIIPLVNTAAKNKEQDILSRDGQGKKEEKDISKLQAQRQRLASTTNQKPELKTTRTHRMDEEKEEDKYDVPAQEPEPEACSRCGKVFKSGSYLEKHIRLMHSSATASSTTTSASTKFASTQHETSSKKPAGARRSLAATRVTSKPTTVARRSLAVTGTKRTFDSVFAKDLEDDEEEKEEEVASKLKLQGVKKKLSSATTAMVKNKVSQKSSAVILKNNTSLKRIISSNTGAATKGSAGNIAQKKPGLASFGCDLCPSLFSTSTGLATHMRYSHGNRM